MTDAVATPADNTTFVPPELPPPPAAAPPAPAPVPNVSVFPDEISESDVPVEETDPAVEAAEDIDPSDWLMQAASESVTPEYVLLKNGKRIQMAPLSDSEELKVRELSKRKEKATGRISMSFNHYKRNFIAASINKAYGRSPGTPGFIIGDQLAQRPTGELNELLKSAFRISGMDLDSDKPQQNAADFFV